MNELLIVLLESLRDGYVQVSAFVAVTVLAFGLIQYRTDGAALAAIEDNERLQVLFGGILGLTPGCGGAIVVMPLYVRGTVSFGTVVATLGATAGDSAFVILALAPEAALYAYAIAFAASVATGYLVDTVGLGVTRVDDAVAQLSPAMADGGTVVNGGVGPNPAHDYGGPSPACAHDAGPDRRSRVLTPLSHFAHVLWWVAAVAGLVLGSLYLLRGGPEVALAAGLGFDGLFTVVGIVGAALSLYLYAVGRHYVGEGEIARARDSFGSVYDTLTHAAMETSFVTVWVLVAFLVYEYAVLLTGIDVTTVAAAAGVLAPIGGAVVGLIPGCGPQILLASVYAEGGLPFSALTANAIAQDGDALFPLLAVDAKAAIVATIYNFLPAVVVGVALHLLWAPVFGMAEFGFGVL
ncbi:putative manganese transporter [Haloterrigena sp. SYSU A558-1]|uniref:Manganese transporter n=1 Tax=Haloterrigena gelatinilytica TaxID=2741724 RepID=A0A8J8GIE0_9EURY|nr:putative manganese transporter [Haloterrigena gelatinilytica]NUB90016.1 putative manganese transporter [Haloterrigena gelatinilytica]NUC74159.1 putative manganese transporter [Haloterrigena gelatinilytica]